MSKYITIVKYRNYYSEDRTVAIRGRHGKKKIAGLCDLRNFRLESVNPIRQDWPVASHYTWEFANAKNIQDIL